MHFTLSAAALLGISSGHAMAFSTESSGPIIAAQMEFPGPFLVDSQDSLMPNSSFLAGTPWVQGPECVWIQSSEYCTFSHPSFNGGEGVSIITTPTNMDILISRSDFNRDPSTNNVDKKPYQLREVPGKGLGLVATQVIRRGQQIVLDSPAVMMDNLVYQSDTSIVADMLVQAVVMLPEKRREEYLSLATHDVSGDVREKIYDIFEKNAFEATLGSVEMSAIYPECKSTMAIDV
jgi:hypothetical protein